MSHQCRQVIVIHGRQRKHRAGRAGTAQLIPSAKATLQSLERLVKNVAGLCHCCMVVAVALDQEAP